MRRLFKSLVASILTAEARLVLGRYAPSIVGITGSVGKTSTKDAVYAALAGKAFVRKSEKSFNSEIGIPLTVLGVPNGWMNPLVWIQDIVDGLLLVLFRARYPEWLVLEVGADRPGDIRSAARWLPLDIAIVTRLPDVPVHVEYFESPEAVAEEKRAIIAALKPSGTLILCADDERVMKFAAEAGGRRVITFGFSGNADVRGEGAEILYSEGPVPKAAGMRMVVRAGEERADATVFGTAGKAALMPLLAAAAVGKALDIPLADTLRSFEHHFTPTPGRMRLLEGVKKTLVIDDSYNASPAAVESALETLSRINASGRKIALLGDMLELGRYSVEEHRKIGARAAHTVDVLATVGFRARDAAEAALGSGMASSAILQFEDSAKAGEELAQMVSEGDVILIKGSQSMRMERAAFELLAEPERARELLVRQEEEWKKR